ncbi:MAG TPA: hypothetical protein VMJ72_01290 [Candidatus Paceibacterota bacterium]|nr:hypothetical protein [Candidatus Paceibacterota bacterium]
MRFAVKPVAFLAVILAAATVGAQTPDPEKWTFDSLTVSAGEDALSSGITGSVWLKKDQQRFNFLVQQKQGWFIYGRQFTVGKLEGLVAGSVGHFDGAPWIGPYVTLDLPLGKVAGQKVSVGTMQWPVIQAWVPDGWKGKHESTPYIGYFASVQASVGPLGLSLGRLDFLDDPINWLPGVSYTANVRRDFSVTSSVTRNTNAKRWMLYVGATWKISS